MAYRYSCKAAAVVTGGTEFTHGLTRGGVATAPDEWFFNFFGAPANADQSLYLTAVPGTTSMIVAASSATQASADVFCAINHSILG